MSVSMPGLRRDSVAAYPSPESVPPTDTCFARIAAALPSMTRTRGIRSSLTLERQVALHRRAEDALERQRVHGDGISARGRIDGRLAADFLRVAQRDADIGERMRNPEFLAEIEHPRQHTVDAGLRQFEHPCDHFHALRNRLAVVHD